MHLDSTKVPGVDASTGSLGHGLSIALGTAIAARLQDKPMLLIVYLETGSVMKELSGKPQWLHPIII